MDLKEYLKERIKTVNKAIQVLPQDAFLKGEILAFESILMKLEKEEK